MIDLHLGMPSEPCRREALELEDVVDQRDPKRSVALDVGRTLPFLSDRCADRPASSPVGDGAIA